MLSLSAGGLTGADEPGQQPRAKPGEKKGRGDEAPAGERKRGLIERLRQRRAGNAERPEDGKPASPKPDAKPASPKTDAKPAQAGEGDHDAGPRSAPAPGAGSAEKAPNSPRQGPQPINPVSAGVGRMVADRSWQALDGRSGTLAESAKEGLVIALTDISCPLCLKYAQALARLEKTLKAQGVNLLLVNPSAADDPKAIAARIRELGLLSPYIHDVKGDFARALTATTTTEVFLLDGSRTVLYRGALDDQYGLGYALDAPRISHLQNAVTAWKAGRPILTPATRAPGCTLDLSVPGNAADTPGTPAWHGRVDRLVRIHCGECHTSGGVAPFALDTPAQLASKKGMIKQVLADGTMPPWFAANASPGHSKAGWLNDRSLPEADRRDLLAWLDGGQPLGDPKDAIAARPDTGGWLIGKPDAVVRIPRPITVKAEGKMPYQNVVVPTSFGEDRWVRAMEIRPTARAVVHHVLVFVMQPGESFGEGRRAESQDERRGYFAAYVPGNSARILPEGYAKRLPKGASLRFQIHYTPNGKATADQLELGFVFSPKEPEFEVRVIGIADPVLRIPPNAADHPERTSLKVPVEVELLGFMPHMHVRGKAFKYEMVEPSGKRGTLLDIPRYDFNWQLSYKPAEPIRVPAGSVIEVTGRFDNSAGNPANPDPSRTVRWGPQTDDEMLIGYVEYTSAPGTGPLKRFDLGALIQQPVSDDGRPKPKLPPGGVPIPAAFQGPLGRFDTDGDGKLSETEIDGMPDRLKNRVWDYLRNNRVPDGA
jgi:mono/diheme cytochrome c family protein